MPCLNRRPAVSACVLITFTLAFCSSLALAQTPNTWVTKAPIPTARFGPGAVSVNGIIYVIGGGISYFGCGPTGANEAYNPATDTWTSMAPMPTPRWNVSVAALNGIIYAVAGSEGCFPPSTVFEAYDPSTNTWSTLAPFPSVNGVGTTGGTAIGAINGLLYVAGGNTTLGANSFQASLYAYDPVTNSWSAKASMPDVRDITAGAVLNGSLYVVGGADNAGTALSTFVYDPASDMWSTKAALSEPRVGLATAVIGNKIYALGGQDGADAVSTLEVYDPAADTWSMLPSMPTSRTFLASAQVNGTIYAISGLLSTASGGLTSAVEAYTPAAAAAGPLTVSCGTADGHWHANNVSIQCNTTDSAELVNPADAAFYLSTTVLPGTTNSSAATTSRLVCDKAGNCATAGPIGGNMIDEQPPAIAILAPANSTYLLNQSAASDYSCADAGSGVASCNGTVVSGSPFDTASVGSKSFVVHSGDQVGNLSAVTSNYTVTYGICLLYNPGIAKKIGSTYPIKLQLCSASGANVSSSAVTLTAMGVATVSGDAPGPLDDSGNSNPDFDFRYDGSGYIFNLNLSGFVTGTYNLQFRAGNDPAIHTAQFQVK
jgi:N-acetylneuraminic acid mutarotase